jgi:hypothetical protein
MLGMSLAIRHEARQQSPTSFHKLSKPTTHGMPDGISVVWGQTASGKNVVQSVTFDGARWPAVDAVKWLKDHDLHSAGFQTTRANENATVENKRWSRDVQVEKLDEEKQIAFGWLYVTRRADGTQVVDHSLEVIGIQELESASYGYVLDSRKGGVMHQKNADGETRVIGRICECVCITAEKKALWGHPGPPLVMNEGTWIGLKVDDPDVWLEFKTRKIRMFSLGGYAHKKEL